ncbi:T9SS type A sorting domain-containing protein [Chryseobacterium chendengshani]|uniref:T9SS type A sorting domain-containing protein n=1 Tax=Chryseobacterium sp. LJ756 TaxID=2864113 RepID=UPI001C644C04|nr:T9SS type A sorting domain-containing protein [Chryseobacterium sp. LJ756]MBW7676536.1 T9SS type A sorting domain-containing protein [Chryseobacterium sp. LJ756]
MKKIQKLLFLMSFIVIYGQSDPYPRQCVMSDDHPEYQVAKNVVNCDNTSPYYSPNAHGNSLYTLQNNDEIIYIKVNFIFLTKPDGTGNFEQNNVEHLNFIDRFIENINYRLGNLEQPINGCEIYPQTTSDTKIRVVVNKIWKVDPAWNFLTTGYNPIDGPLGGSQLLYPPSANFYYSYLDNDPSIPLGINVTFANNGDIYNAYNIGNYNTPAPEVWAASQFPYYNPLNGKLRQFWPDFYNGFLSRKHFVVGNPNFGYPTWETVKEWYASDAGARGFVHELGHNFDLIHHDCGSNIMSYAGGSNNYLSNTDISTMYLNSSISSVRQYFTENSFKNTSIKVNTNEIWDLNVRHYSNVRIENNSSLKVTCKLIMAPESRVIARSGSNFIIEGAEILSADNTTWNGIKIEGNGYCLILPDTKINNEYFYVYHDNTTFPNNKQSVQSDHIKKESKIGDNNFKDIKEDFLIFPNPTGDFINIKTDDEIIKINIYDSTGKIILKFNKDFGKSIDVRSLIPGNYILKVETNLKNITKKFIKK